MSSAIFGWDAGSENSVAGYDLIVRLREGVTVGAGADQANLRELAATALVAKGNGLAKLGQNEEAIRAFEEVLGRFGDVQDLAIKKQLAQAMTAKGRVLKVLGDDHQAAMVFEDVITRFGDAEAVALQEAVATALLAKGNGIAAEGRDHEAIAVFDEISNRYGES